LKGGGAFASLFHRNQKMQSLSQLGPSEIFLVARREKPSTRLVMSDSSSIHDFLRYCTSWLWCL